MRNSNSVSKKLKGYSKPEEYQVADLGVSLTLPPMYLIKGPIVKSSPMGNAPFWFEQKAPANGRHDGGYPIPKSWGPNQGKG